MTSSFSPKSVLEMGLLPNDKDQNAVYTKDVILKIVDENKERLSKLNITLKGHLVNPSLPLSTNVSDVKALLEDRNYDAVSIGFGLRGKAEHTDIFTELVNLIVEHGKNSDGKPPKLLFGLAPTQMAEMVQKLWPDHA